MSNVINIDVARKRKKQKTKSTFATMTFDQNYKMSPATTVALIGMVALFAMQIKDQKKRQQLIEKLINEALNKKPK